MMTGNSFTALRVYFDFDSISNTWLSFLHQNLPIVKMPKENLGNLPH